MSAWGVVRADPSPAGPPGDRFSALRAVLGGIVVVPNGHAPSASRGPLHGSVLGDLLLGLREVPPDADVVTVLDARMPIDETLESVSLMLEHLDGGVDGVVRGVPVTDALKRVDADGTVIGDVDRAGLFVPQTPQVIRRASLEAALLVSVPRPRTDPTSFLIRCGYPVRVLWGAAHPARDAHRARG